MVIFFARVLLMAVTPGCCCRRLCLGLAGVERSRRGVGEQF